MLELLFEIGMLPFWIGAAITCLCLIGAWFRKSRRAAGLALTVVWIAGLFYVPYLLWQYARYSQAQEAAQAGAELSVEEARNFREVQRVAWTYGVLLSVTGGTYVLLQRRKSPKKRKQNLQVEYLKAVEAKRTRAATGSQGKAVDDTGEAIDPPPAE